MPVHVSTVAPQSGSIGQVAPGERSIELGAMLNEGTGELATTITCASGASVFPSSLRQRANAIEDAITMTTSAPIKNLVHRCFSHGRAGSIGST